jgi:hypothetical protein
MLAGVILEPPGTVCLKQNLSMKVFNSGLSAPGKFSIEMYLKFSQVEAPSIKLGIFKLDLHLILLFQCLFFITHHLTGSS